MKKIAILGGAAIIAALAWAQQPAKTQKGGNQKAQDSVGENDQPVVISDGSILFTGVSTLRADATDHTIQLIVPKVGVTGLAFQTVELPGNPNTVTVNVERFNNTGPVHFRGWIAAGSITLKLSATSMPRSWTRTVSQLNLNPLGKTLTLPGFQLTTDEFRRPNPSEVVRIASISLDRGEAIKVGTSCSAVVISASRDKALAFPKPCAGRKFSAAALAAARKFDVKANNKTLASTLDVSGDMIAGTGLPANPLSPQQ